MKNIRWKQRFENLEKSYVFFKESCGKNSYSKLELSGLVKSYELTFELFWKTLKDYLESQGELPKFPRDTLKLAYQKDIITNGHKWIEMLDKRNELTHVYSDEESQQAVQIIKSQYAPEFEQLFDFLKKESAKP